MTTQPYVRKAIDEVQLAGPQPTSGKEVIDHLFPLTVEAAKPLTLHYNCKTQMHSGIGITGKTNDQSFDQCFQHGGYQQAKPELMKAAYRHGELSRLIQQVLDPTSSEVSLQAYEAAGAAVRKLCSVTCAGALGQWCDWP
jgi:hypothetical protein